MDQCTPSPLPDPHGHYAPVPVTLQLKDGVDRNDGVAKGAAVDLRRLAKDAGGKFTIVNQDGTTTEDDMRGRDDDPKKKK